MVTESDFIAALQAYQDTLANPGTKIEDVRPHIENHLNELIGHLPSIAQSIAKERAYVELDKIELIAKDRAIELAEKVQRLEDKAKIAKFDNLSFSTTGAAVEVEPTNPQPNTPIIVYFGGSSGDSSAWIGIYPEGAPHGEHHSNWLYVGGSQTLGEGKVSGAVTFTEGREIGDYEARLFKNNNHEMIASCSFSIIQPEPEPIPPLNLILEPEPEPELEPEPEPELEPRSLPEIVEHLDTLKLFGEKRRFIESQQNIVFNFILSVDKVEKTIGLGLSDEYRGGDTCIGKTEGIDVGVRMPNTASEVSINQDIEIQAKIIEYRAVVQRFEFIQI